MLYCELLGARNEILDLTDMEFTGFLCVGFTLLSLAFSLTKHMAGILYIFVEGLNFCL